MTKSRHATGRNKNAAAGRTSLVCGRSRRLGVEAMEGRLMLSAVSPLLAPLHFQALPFAQPAEQTSPAPVQGVAAPSLTEGGFIPTGVLLNSASGITVASYGSGTTNSAVDLRAASDSGLSSNDNITLVLTPTLAGWLQGGATVAIQPIVIVPSSPGTELQSSTPPLPAGSSGHRADPDRGGAIPLESILSAGGPFRGSESSDRGVTKFSSAPADGSIRPMRSDAAVSAAGSAISGEWARAMVFEMAGGEPLAFGRPAGASQFSPLRDAGSSETAAPVSGAPAKGGAAKSEPPSPPAHPPHGQTSAIVEPRNPTAGSRTSIEPAEPAADQSDKLAAASADVFAQLGAGPGATAILIRDDQPQRGSFDAAPLVVALAVERLAARTSRRANEKAVSLVARP